MIQTSLSFQEHISSRGRPQSLAMSPKVVSMDLKHAAIRMSRLFPVQIVALCLDISENTVRRSVQQYEEIGEILPHNSAAWGRKTVLDEEDRKVSHIEIIMLP